MLLPAVSLTVCVPAITVCGPVVPPLPTPAPPPSVPAVVPSICKWNSPPSGGVPGRGEIDETQEINYPAVMKAILATGVKGFVAQEFVPKRSDALASLKQGVQICDV